MKFKTIFLLFNLVVLFAFLFVALVPYIMLGNEFSQLFWSQNWILVVLFILFIILLDGYFVLNWKLFIYMESEDWPGLMNYLEERIFQKGKLNSKNLSMYINTCLSVSNLEKIARLELEVREKKPELLPALALPFGIPYLLKNDNSEAELYFRNMLEQPGLKQKPWIEWCLAFSLISQKKIEPSVEPLLSALKEEKKDAVLKLLDLYLLDSLRTQIPSEEQDFISKSTMELKKKISSQNDWERVLSRSRDKNILTTLLGSLVKEARQWILKVEG